MTDDRLPDLHLVAGKWEPIPKIVPDSVFEMKDWQLGMRNEGWGRFAALGGGEGCELAITTWSRPVEGKPDQYLVQVEGGMVTAQADLLVDTLPELMDLLTRWAPAVQVAIFAQIVDDLNVTEADRLGLVERVAYRAAYGIREGEARR